MNARKDDDEPRYESERYGFKPGALGPRDDAEEPEFDDLPPGAHLAELELGPGATALGAAVAVATLATAALIAALRPWTELATTIAVITVPSGLHDASAIQPPWVAPLDTVWSLLPGVAIAGLLITCFVRFNLESATRARVRMLNWAIGLHLASCATWGLARWAFGVGFE